MTERNRHKVVGLIHLANDRKQWLAFVNTAIKFFNLCHCSNATLTLGRIKLFCIAYKDPVRTAQ